MPKLQRRQRRKSPSKTVKNLFGSAVIQLASEFLKSESFGHALTKGEEREQPVINFLSNVLPKTFAVSGGEVIDLNELKSPQLDVMIWDQVRNFGFYTGSKVIIPAEALIVSIEVKTKLTLNEIKKSLKAAVKLHELQPFKKPIAQARTGGKGHDGVCRYFHCVFAYDSDLVNGDDYLKREYKRYEKAINDVGCDSGVIERIYVANRGVMNPRKKWGLMEETNQGDALMHFYLDIFNFLTRENGRRDQAPYIGYIGQIGKTNWEKLDN